MSLFWAAMMILWAIAGYQYWLAKTLVEPTLPAELMNEGTTFFAVDRHIADRLVPAAARRHYLACFALMALSLGAFAVSDYIAGDTRSMVISAGLTAVLIVLLFTRWIRFRGRL